jgi:hypothetical protein
MNCVFCGEAIRAEEELPYAPMGFLMAQHASGCKAHTAGNGPTFYLLVIANLLGEIATRLESIDRRGEREWFQDRRNER